MRGLRTLSFAGLLLAGAALGALPVVASEPAALELLHPAGATPKVFTEGWVFGARCVVGAGSPGARDVSDQVEWSGTGTFEPARGALSRPKFRAAGPNRIVLSISVGNQLIRREFDVVAVDPRPTADGAVRYARVGDYAKCLACAHGCPACPHVAEGPITAGSPNVTIDGVPAARVGDPGTQAGCCGPNTFEIVQGDEKVLIDGKPAARLGDRTRHCGGEGKIVGAPAAFYIAFGATQLDLKPGRKPERAEGESDEAWAARRKAAFAAMTWRDLDFKPPESEAPPVVIHVTGAALGVHVFPFGLGEGGRARFVRYVLPVEGAMRTTTSPPTQVNLAGALLLTLVDSYRDLATLRAAHPGLEDDDIGHMLRLDGAKGTGTVVQDGHRLGFGPLRRASPEGEDWSDAEKEAAAALYLAIMPYFDCFVADAVYADPAAHVPNVLRDFRARVLLRTEAGRRLVRLYEDHGPAFALRVRTRSGTRSLARLALGLLARRIESLDLDDAATLERLGVQVAIVERLASAALASRPSPALGRLARLFSGTAPSR